MSVCLTSPIAIIVAIIISLLLAILFYKKIIPKFFFKKENGKIKHLLEKLFTILITIIVFFLLSYITFLIAGLFFTSCSGLGSYTPNIFAGDMLKSSVNNLGLVEIRSTVFTNGESLNSKSIASYSKILSVEQICVLLGNSIQNKDEFIVNQQGKVIQYEGSFTQNNNLLTLCDRGNEINESISAWELEEKHGIKIDNCNLTENNENKYCIVAIVGEA
tara:strand:+ start:6486 stop:7139 length:654 start_codon:yes stop_codon:yes gene_type:complete